MNALILAAVFGISPFVIPPPFSGYFTPGAGTDIRNADDWYDTTPMSSDAAVTPQHVITGKPSYQGSAAPTNTTGGSVGIIPASGGHKLEITNVANLMGDADTLTFTTCLMELAACATTVVTFNAGGINCVGTTAECALAAKTYLDAHATLGPATVVTCTDATCSDSKFFIGQTAGVASHVHVAYASGGSVGLTLADGADGQFLVGPGSAAAPAVAPITDPNTGISFPSADTVVLGTNATTMFSCNTTSCTSTGALNGSTYMYTGRFVGLPQTITCADSADGNHSTCGGAVTISSNVVGVTCADADGCTLTLAETNFSATVTGQITIMMSGANHVDLADSANVLELDGGAAFAMVAGDTIDLIYDFINLAWRERNRHTDA